MDSEPLPFTGERFIPGTRGEIWIEHWHRYHFASRWCAGARVLDVACGEGYGSALVARNAARVVGVDVSAEAIAHARRAYAEHPNVDFLCASCTRLPLADASIDVAISFETLEHIAGQEAFLDELARVLRPDGVLLLSCPNKSEYSDRRDFVNAFHVKELYREELRQLVAARFEQCDWYGQRPTFYSVIAPEGAPAVAAQLAEGSEERPDQVAPVLSQPLYFVLAASRTRSRLDATPRALSVFADRGDWVYKDYEKVMGWMESAVARADALERELAERNKALAERDREIAARRGWRGLLRVFR